MAQRKFYNPELDTTERYTEVWKIELVQVRDESNLMVRNHYWKDSDGELWVDFNNPMENVTRSFAAYRSKKGYMTPEDIRKLRHKLGLTVRQFAKRLGIAPSSLTQIENNLRVQVKYQDNLFKAAKTFYEENGHLPGNCSSNEDGVIDKELSGLLDKSEYQPSINYAEDHLYTNNIYTDLEVMGVAV